MGLALDAPNPSWRSIPSRMSFPGWLLGTTTASTSYPPRRTNSGTPAVFENSLSFMQESGVPIQLALDAESEAWSHPPTIQQNSADLPKKRPQLPMKPAQLPKKPPQLPKKPPQLPKKRLPGPYHHGGLRSGYVFWHRQRPLRATEGLARAQSLPKHFAAQTSISSLAPHKSLLCRVLKGVSVPRTARRARLVATPIDHLEMQYLLKAGLLSDVQTEIK